MHAAERLQTAWLTFLNPNKPFVPQLLVQFTAVGSEIRSVIVTMQPLSPEYLSHHKRLVEEFHDPSAWPKHLIIVYRWSLLEDEDVASGTLVLLATCVLPPLRCELVHKTCTLVHRPTPAGRRSPARALQNHLFVSPLSTLDTGMGSAVTHLSRWLRHNACHDQAQW
jgi:hypothetical protein